MKLEIIVSEVGYLKTNCYIVRDTETGKAFIVDPGYVDDKFEKKLEELSISGFDYILLTHGHFDHILGITEIQEKFGGKIVIHEDDEKFFTDSSLSLNNPGFFREKLPQKADITVIDGDEIPFAGSSIKTLHTPGHTGGSVCYILENNIFSGDTLFRESIGRTDFPTGSSEKIIASLWKLAEINGDYRVLPGHGEETTLDHERRCNPYLK